ARALVHSGEALELLARDAEAHDRFARAAELDPELADAEEGLLRACCKLGRDDQALPHAKRHARLRRFDARSLQLLADTQFSSSNLQTCLRTYRRAIRTDPESPAIRSAYLFAAIHDLRQTPASLRALHEEWFRRHAPGREAHEFPNGAREKLRIGYVSIEFRSSPTEYFLLPLLEAHDREQFEIYCYHFWRSNDAVTDKYKQASTHWRDIATASEDEMLRTMRQDELDILIDASGHFAPRLMSALARRAAPVQVALPIYPATRGCPEIDYILSDRWTTPDRVAEAQYVEQVWRIPAGYVVYAPPAGAPKPGELPAQANGHITFGLFQRPAKFNDELWRAAGAILQRTPGSHLLVHHGTRDLDEPESGTRVRIRQILAAHGVAKERIDFAGRREIRQHMETVAQADIALDTFPYSGHTTTGDALWMGVPVVTFAGRTHASRVSCGLVARIGLDDWVASSLEEYVGIAVAKAQDRGALGALRSELRRRMANSSVCQARLVVRELEEAYRAMRAAATRAV
ncbi:MAG TPA: hypothetical protein VGF59_30490, partial [Bryobacteraceae bacterium]